MGAIDGSLVAALDHGVVVGNEIAVLFTQEAKAALQLLGHPFVIGIQESKVGLGGLGQCPVPGRAGAMVGLEDYFEPDAVHSLGYGKCRLVGTVVGAVVDDDDLAGPKALTRRGQRMSSMRRA